MLLGSEGNCDTCKSFIKGLLNKMRQHFQKFLLSSLTLRRVIFAVNGLLGATFANFVQKRASYSTFTYIPRSVFPCRLKLMSEETGIAATCKTKIWLNKFLTWLHLATEVDETKFGHCKPRFESFQRKARDRSDSQKLFTLIKGWHSKRCRLIISWPLPIVFSTQLIEQNSLKRFFSAAEVAHDHRYSLRAG